MKTPRFMAVLVAMVALAIAGCGSDDTEDGGRRILLADPLALERAAHT